MAAVFLTQTYLSSRNAFKWSSVHACGTLLLKSQNTYSVKAGGLSSTAVNDKVIGNSTLDFTDYRKAFGSKSWRELTRALMVLGICSNQTFSANSLKVCTFQHYKLIII